MDTENVTNVVARELGLRAELAWSQSPPLKPHRPRGPLGPALWNRVTRDPDHPGPSAVAGALPEGPLCPQPHGATVPW